LVFVLVSQSIVFSPSGVNVGGQRIVKLHDGQVSSGAVSTL
jgi:hypothetical protein